MNHPITTERRRLLSSMYRDEIFKSEYLTRIQSHRLLRIIQTERGTYNDDGKVLLNKIREKWVIYKQKS